MYMHILLNSLYKQVHTCTYLKTDQKYVHVYLVLNVLHPLIHHCRINILNSQNCSIFKKKIASGKIKRKCFVKFTYMAFNYLNLTKWEEGRGAPIASLALTLCCPCYSPDHIDSFSLILWISPKKSDLKLKNIWYVLCLKNLNLKTVIVLWVVSIGHSKLLFSSIVYSGVFSEVYSIRSKTARTLLIKDYANSLTNKTGGVRR